MHLDGFWQGAGQSLPPSEQSVTNNRYVCIPGGHGLPHTSGDPSPELSCMFPFYFRRRLKKMLSYIPIRPAPHGAVNGVTHWARHLEIVRWCLLIKGKDQIKFPFSCCQCLTSSKP